MMRVITLGLLLLGSSRTGEATVDGNRNPGRQEQMQHRPRAAEPVGNAPAQQEPGAADRSSRQAGVVDELDKWLKHPVGEPRRQKLAALVDQLDAPAYSLREDVSTQLIEAGPEALSMLRAAFRVEESLESLMRIEEVVREIYLKHYVYDRNAFLGIQQSLTPKQHDDDSRIPAGFIGIEIRQILPKTAAEDADLKANDVIIALDDESITGNGQQAVLAFGESIRRRGPGAPLKLTLLRGPEKLQFELVLRARPKSYYNVSQGPVFDMLDSARRGFELFWERHFSALKR